MKETVTDPLLFFLRQFYLVVCLQAIYDIIRGIRRVFYHKSVFLFIEDIGFGIFTAVMAFIFLCTYNDGELKRILFPRNCDRNDSILSIMQQVPFEGCHTYYREAKRRS